MNNVNIKQIKTSAGIKEHKTVAEKSKVFIVADYYFISASQILPVYKEVN